MWSKHLREEASEAREVGNLPKVAPPSGDSRSRILDSGANMVAQAASGRAQEVGKIQDFMTKGGNCRGVGAQIWLVGPWEEGEPGQLPRVSKPTSAAHLPAGTWAIWTTVSSRVPCGSCGSPGASGPSTWPT